MAPANETINKSPLTRELIIPSKEEGIKCTVGGSITSGSKRMENNPEKRLSPSKKRTGKFVFWMEFIMASSNRISASGVSDTVIVPELIVA